jgi:glycosyltransferase involved in cell wall biosynthesis
VPIDLAVLGQDPRFGGGGSAQTDAFLAGASALGRDPELLFDPHPGLGERELTWRRLEALRQLEAARRLEARAHEARSLWVVASLAQNGGAAPRTGRRYGCWVGTTIRSEWSGRSPGLSAARRAAAAVSIRALAALERRVLREAARLYATSPSSRDEVAEVAGVAASDVGILPIPVDVERLQPAPDEAWRQAAAQPVLTFVGRADDPRKNVSSLLRAFADVRTSHPDARLRLVGRPPLGPLPPGVEAAGEVVDVGAELRRAAIFVLPSRQEGFGIVAAEAMACGLPVVTTPSGGPEDLVGRSGGGVVASGFGAQDLASTLHGLLSNGAGLPRMRQTGLAHVRREHSLDRFRESLSAALAEVDG